jgi:hypothetical protein
MIQMSNAIGIPLDPVQFDVKAIFGYAARPFILMTGKR